MGVRNCTASTPPKPAWAAQPLHYTYSLSLPGWGGAKEQIQQKLKLQTNTQATGITMVQKSVAKGLLSKKKAMHTEVL